MKPFTSAFLARNMAAAIQTFRLHQSLLRIIAIADRPVTTQELLSYCRYRVAPVGLFTLRRRLTQLRKARVLRTYRIHAHCSVWVLAGQPRPPKRKERRQVYTPLPPAIERRRESWWVQNSRAGFEQAMRDRWNS